MTEPRLESATAFGSHAVLTLGLGYATALGSRA